MIVPMQKVTVLCLARERDRALQSLGELGVVHLVPFEAAVDTDLDSCRADLARAERAIAILKAHATDLPPAENTAGESVPAAAASEAVQECVDSDSQLELVIAEAEALDEALATQAPFGDFDPALARQIAARGVRVALCHADKEADVEVPVGAVCTVLRRDKTGIYYVLIGAFDGAITGERLMPERSLKALRAERAAVASRIDALEKKIRVLAGAMPAIREHVQRLNLRRAFCEARAGMGANQTVAYLQGFCPKPDAAALQAEAARHGWAVMAGEPAAGEPVPTLVSTPRWLVPIQSLFKFIRIFPGYNEVDVSASFMLFLSLFFAMIVGDAGYGAIFLGGTLLARRKLRTAPAGPFHLMIIFSVCTIIWGVLTGVYFGLTNMPGLFTPRVMWLTDDSHVMALCILIGAIHLTVAHGWNMLRFINSTRAIAQAGWIAITWVIYFIARAMLLKAPLPGFTMMLAAAGLLAVLFFMTPWRLLKSEWVNHAMLPLTLMSNFGDILSYLRLWALGIAGVQLADAFNRIVGPMFNAGFLGWVGGVLILFVGHGLNIILSALSVLVHGIRLNALEFSMHMGLEWTGFEFKPFRLPRGTRAGT